jgi:hypothetical protein
MEVPEMTSDKGPEIERMNCLKVPLMLKVTLPKALAGVFGPVPGEDAVTHYNLDGIAMRRNGTNTVLVLRYMREDGGVAPFPPYLYMDGDEVTQQKPDDIHRYKAVKSPGGL